MQFKKVRSAMVVASSLSLIACAPPTSPTPPSIQPGPPPTTGQAPDINTESCPASELQYLVGQSRTVLQTMRFGGEVRFEEPGQMVTADFVATRTRIIIGGNGRIERILCG